MANFYPATSYTGDVDGALDHINGDLLADGDGGVVITTTNHDVYHLNASSGASADPPNIIIPAANAGTKRWIRTSSTALSGSTVGFTLGYEKTDKPAAGAEWDITPPIGIIFSASLTGWAYTVRTNPTAQQVVSFQKNGVEFGTLTANTDGTHAFASTSGASINGTTDKVTVVFPASQDATWAGVSITAKGVRI